MKLATRINSYLRIDGYDLDKTFADFETAGLGYVDLNYPEHVKDKSPSEIKVLLNKHHLKLNGVALRFRGDFINGELGNSDPEIANKALQLCKDAVDYCREAGGQVVTIWLGFDGFDYNFQINYRKVWDQLVHAYQTVCDYAPDLKISIEYKPYEERAYAFVDSMGVTGMLLNDVNRKNIGVTLDYCHMLMKHENPAFAADIFGSRGQLYGIHANDGYGVADDGLMIGTASPFKTLELLYYLKKHNYDGVIYFDTFPVIEPAVEEAEMNVQMITHMNQLIDDLGLDYIQSVIDKNDAIEASKLMLTFFKGNK
ncbi:xylose isomerase [Streptococcus gallolyticus]|uniref:Xylose isomerase n=1 Tax=Streptococcus gallolyticus TaxID=315405 RepID=A0A1H7XPC9_9STRE|nr:sugar phosphate isomerase/epimerase family protein [Streptococcus gallolyticus]SEF22688.1 xylose isomerase [Streptococcus gallolyticus]SEM35545.1 xylose isomerase [Streptococcus gallolyticus]SER88178.1 xylose isomerase [Streptococcus gallolyticus]